MQALQQTASVIQIHTNRKKTKKAKPFVYEQIKPFGLCVSPSKETNISRLSQEDVSSLRQLTLEHKVLVLRGFSKLQKEELVNFSERFGEVQEWLFGKILELKVNENPESQLFTTEKIPYHWDGTFTTKVPHFQLLQCVKAAPLENGGETFFCNTSRVLDKLNNEQINSLKQINIEYRSNKLANYGSDVVRPLIDTHPVTNENILRFAEEAETELNRIFLTVNGLDDQSQDDFMHDFVPQLYQDDVVYSHQWQDDDLLLADNHALLHGRNAFSKCIDRHLRRVHIM